MTKAYRIVSAADVLAGLSPARRAKVDKRVAELIAEEAGLNDPRKEESPRVRRPQVRGNKE